MKKPKKEKKEQKTLDPREVIKDIDKLLNFATHIDALDLNEADLDGIGEEALALEKEMRKKYKGFYDNKDIRKNLDIKK
tara:strand:- start:126 stop:362 length:237 start_codon:yes stop_codon:yes gene_type:complete